MYRHSLEKESLKDCFLVNVSSYFADNEYVNLFKSQEENKGTQNYSVKSWVVILIILITQLVCMMYALENKRKDSV